jgi:hypothetical protein
MHGTIVLESKAVRQTLAVDHGPQLYTRFPLHHPVHHAIWLLRLAGWLLSNIVPDQWRLLCSLDPMVDVIDGFRRCILGEHSRPICRVSRSVSPTAFFVWLRGLSVSENREHVCVSDLMSEPPRSSSKIFRRAT